jgi:large repetitive protein
MLYGQIRISSDDLKVNEIRQEITKLPEGSRGEIQLPDEYGNWTDFGIKASNFLSESLSNSRTDFRSYILWSKSNRLIRGRISVSMYGMDVFLMTPEGILRIQANGNADAEEYIIYIGDHPELEIDDHDHFCTADHEDTAVDKPELLAEDIKQLEISGDFKRIFKLAIATTGQFYLGNGGTIPLAQTAVMNSVAAIQAIFENDLTVGFELLPPTIYTDPNTDPFVQGGSRVIMAIQAIHANYSVGTYDIGHVFHNSSAPPTAELPGGGVAYLGVVCLNSSPSGTNGPYKAGGWSGSFNNTTNSWIQLAAHEIGHQFNAAHTFNGSGNSCSGGNYSAANAFEIGSGSTIMSYQGICSASQNIPSQGVLDNYFHVSSLVRMNNYINISGGCKTETATGNTPPTAVANPCGISGIIPISTPFELRGQGIDPDNDELTYTWEQFDAGANTQGLTGAAAGANPNAPLFRSYPPSLSPNRTFPNIALVITNNYSSTFEPLPSVSRQLNFGFTVRDNHPGSGGVDYQGQTVTVDNSGPFTVVSPNGGETVNVSNPLTVQWNVNGTNAICSEVNILLSVDGGYSYPFLLESGVSNNGSYIVNLPQGIPNSEIARIRVECAVNPCVVFFDISNANFEVVSNCFAPATFISPVNFESFPSGDPGLNLSLSNNLGDPITIPISGSITGNEAISSNVKASIECGSLNCTFFTNNTWFDVYPFQVNIQGNYTFTPSANFSHAITLYEGGFSTGNQCTNILGSSRCHNPPNVISGSVSPISVELTPGIAYSLVSSNFFFGTQTGNYSISVSGPPNSGLYDGAILPTGYDYTYVALNLDNDLIAMVSSSANFSGLSVGDYCIYGVSFKASGATPPSNSIPSNWIGQSINSILTGGECVLFSNNCKALEIVPALCELPIISEVLVTHPSDCAFPVGSIVINATANGTLEFSIDNGNTWQLSNSFNNISPGSYNLLVRLLNEPFCITYFDSNPVIVNVPPGCCTQPEVVTVDVTQPTCEIQTGTISISGTGSGTLEYSIDNGISWQISSLFDFIPPGSYSIAIRYLSEPGCFSTFTGNPIILDIPAGCCPDPIYDNSCVEDYIDGFIFGSFSNQNSGCGGSLPGNISDYTGTGPTVNPGITYNVSITVGSDYAQYIGLYIDFNQDGDFLDPGEFFNLGQIAAGETLSTDVLIPSDVPSGETNMRVRSSWEGLLTQADGCGTTLGWGEVEDYSIFIVPACISPIITEVNITQPDCFSQTGSIVILANGSSALEYSIDNGSNFHPSGSFANLMEDSYNIQVRLQSNPNCSTNYSGNPVTINAPLLPTQLICPEDIVQVNDPGQCGANVIFSASVTGDCSATLSYSHSPGSFFPIGTTLVTITSIDSNGTSINCTFNITISDNETPIISCPVDITVSNDPGQCGAIVSFEAITTDNCSASISYQPASGSFFPVGTTSVTATATDASGNTSTCLFEVTVNDSEPPIFTGCPTDTVVLFTLPSTCVAIAAWDVPIASDNCTPPQVTTNFSLSDSLPLGHTTVVYQAEDVAGNIAQCSFEVSVNDTETPIISCPDDFTVSNDPGQCGATVTFEATATDNCSASISYQPASGSFFSTGTTIVTATATDASGNTSTCSFEITVNDTETPIISCPVDITVSNDPDQCGAIVTFEATATDNCTATISYQPASGSFFSTGSTIVTATATDASGNTSTCIFEVNVNDTEAPLVSCPDDITVSNDPGQCGAIVTFEATATDNCSTSISYQPASGSFFSTGTTIVTATATDASGNTSTCIFEVTVNDTETPIISCPVDITVSNDPGQCGAIVTFEATVTDNCSASISYQPASGSFFSTGTTIVTATATDASGNTSTCIFEVTVNDTETPIISCPVDITVSNDPGQCGAIVTFEATVTDNCSASISYQPASGSFFSTGTTIVTATATDASGNTITCIFEVTVNDTEAPIISCPDDIIISNDPGQCGAFVTFEATITDNCGASINYQPASGSFFSTGTTIVTATVTDASGNTSTCTFEVTVNDTETPIISCPVDITVSNDPGQCGAIVTFEATVTDNCSASISYQPASGSFFSTGTTIVTATATDASGNTITCIFEVTVNDTEAPIISCPDDIIISNDPGQCGAFVTFEATITDNCGASINYQPASGSFFSTGTTIVTATVTDASGNTSTCTFEVTVNDTEAPIISCPNDITVSNDPGQCGAIVTFAATATDNCAASINYQPASGSFFSTGTTAVTATATDASGNTSTCSFEVSVNDAEAPQLICPGDITVTVPFGSNGGNVSLNSASATDNCPNTSLTNDFNSNGANASGFYPIGITTVTFTASDEAGNSVECQINITVNEAAPDQLNISCPQNVFSNNDPGLCGSDLTISLASFSGGAPPVSITNTFNNGGADASGFYPVGITNVIFAASDDLGNTAVCSFSVTVEDVEFPFVFCPDNVTLFNEPGQCGAIANFEASATDNCDTDISYQPASGTFFSVGTSTVTATVTDASGNISTCIFDVTVIDTEAPIITCPVDITISNDPGQCGAIVIFEATATDNCTATISYQPASETFFSVGTSTVTATVTDASGSTSTCIFEVTVIDTEAPIITCPVDITVSNDPGQCGAIVNFEATASDNCDTDISYQPASGTFFSVGTSTVTATVTDASGNISTCIFEVTVIDTEAPIISCPVDITVSNDPGQCGAIVTFEATATDNCDTDISYQPASGTFFSVGTSTVTATVTDASGNISTCIFEVTVIDTEAPIITCPVDITVSNDPGQCGAIVNFEATAYR